MSGVFRDRAMKLLFGGNFVSMLGSGMNAAALNWYVLEKTHSAVSLGTLVLWQTLPMLLLAPVAGVVADRVDRRRLVMSMDAARALIIAAVAAICVLHRETLLELYAMSVLVSAATSIFWPTMTALTQEMVAQEEYATANGLLMAGVQGGFLVAGALVGLVYNHIGLGGVLFADAGTYVVSLICYGRLRHGRHVVIGADGVGEGIAGRFTGDLSASIGYLRANLYAVLLCTASAIIFAAIFSQNVVMTPLADVLHSGAVGFGWINAAWAIGALAAGGLAPPMVRRFGVKSTVAVSVLAVAVGCVIAPFCGRLSFVLIVFVVMGAARGTSVVGVNTGLMEAVPRHFMGRVQNLFAMVSRTIQIALGMALGVLAHRTGLAFAFCALGATYFVAALAAAFAGSPATVLKTQPAQTATAERRFSTTI